MGRGHRLTLPSLNRMLMRQTPRSDWTPWASSTAEVGWRVHSVEVVWTSTCFLYRQMRWLFCASPVEHDEVHTRAIVLLCTHETRTCRYIHSHVLTHMHAQADTYTHTHTHTHTHTCLILCNKHLHTDIYLHALTQTNTHRQTHMPVHTFI